VRRLLRKTAWPLGVLLFVILCYEVFMAWTRFRPPEVRIPPAGEVISVHGKTTLKGAQAWLAPEGRLWEMHLGGSPAELGMAQSLLGSFLMREQEAYFIDQLERLIPSRWIQRSLKIYVRWRFWGLDEELPKPFREELRAMALMYSDPYAHLEETYQRFVYLHAFHDIAQGLERSPLIGCSAFGAWGPSTRDGHLILGRNFDFEEGRIFDTRKAVLFFRPTGGIPFVSVAWAGMAGVVTGLNAEGIFVSVNAARSREIRSRGMPVAFALRRILQEARSLEEAISILRETPAMVADIFLLGDGKARRAVVVEKTPFGMEVREGAGFVLATNHFLEAPLQEDPENLRLMGTTSTLRRHGRLDELLRRGSGGMDPRAVLEVLRDRKGMGGASLAPGNRNALNALLACHSVVVDATEGLIWVSESPNLLGAYRCFDLKEAVRNPNGSARRPSDDLPEDPFLTSGQYDDYLLFSGYCKMAEGLYRGGDLDGALDYCQRALSLYSDHPQPNLLAGRILLQRKDRVKAEEFLRRYLRASPSDPSEAASIERLLSEGR
jgi:tetratricopeptide (TPR) repeat protein